MGNRVVIGVGVGGNVAKGQTLVAGPLDLSAVIHPSGIAIDEQSEKGCRMMRVFAASGIGFNERAQIKPFDYVDDKARKMILR